MDIDALMEDKPKSKTTVVEPSIIPTQVTPIGKPDLPELNPQHPLNRPEDIPEAPAGGTILGVSSEEEVYKFVQDNFDKFLSNYEEGFIPKSKPHPEGRELYWTYAPDYAESTLMQYHSAKQTTDIQSFRDKVDQVIIERVEERDATRVRQFVEVVNYDTEACRPILEGDSGFLSEIASMDVVDFNLKYLQVKELQTLNKTMHMILESLAKLTQGIPT